MVVYPGMHQFMQNHVVQHLLRQQYQFDIKADIILVGAASPPCFLLSDGDVMTRKSMFAGKITQTVRDSFFGICLIYRLKWNSQSLLSMFIFLDYCQMFLNPSFLNNDKFQGSLERSTYRDGYSNPFCRTHRDDNPSCPPAAVETH